MAATIRVNIIDHQAHGLGPVRYTLTQNGTNVGTVADTAERSVTFASYTAGANDTLVLTIEPRGE